MTTKQNYKQINNKKHNYVHYGNFNNNSNKSDSNK